MSEPNPWSSSRAEPEFRPPDSAPKVVTWFKVYAVLSAMVYLSLVFVGGWMMSAPNVLMDGSTDEGELLITGGMLVVIGLPFTIAYVIPFFLNPSRGAWIFGLVLIGLPMISGGCCWLPVGLPLLIYWVKQDNKDYFQFQ